MDGKKALTAPTAIFTDTGSLLPSTNADQLPPCPRPGRRGDGRGHGRSGESINFTQALVNSIIVSAIVVIGQVTSCAMAAYAFARLNFPFRDTLFGIYIAALMVPAIVTTIPNFILMRQLGWLNTYAGIVAPTLLMTPFAVFFLRQFFLGVNREVEEATRMDGASIWTSFIRVVVPITMPALTTLAIVTLIATWNSYSGR